MPAIKCSSCARYSRQDGCALEQTHYWQYRNCMLDERNSWIPRQEKEEIRDAELQKHINDILDGQQG